VPIILVGSVVIVSATLTIYRDGPVVI